MPAADRLLQLPRASSAHSCGSPARVSFLQAAQSEGQPGGPDSSMNKQYQVQKKESSRNESELDCRKLISGVEQTAHSIHQAAGCSFLPGSPKEKWQMRVLCCQPQTRDMLWTFKESTDSCVISFWNVGKTQPASAAEVTSFF